MSKLTPEQSFQQAEALIQKALQGNGKVTFQYLWNLEEMPEIPVGITELDCSQLKIEYLPELPEGLITLRAVECTELDEITNFPSTLQEINFNKCYNLTEIPILPVNLKHLELGRTQISELPELPVSAGASYEVFPPNLLTLNIEDLPLTSLPPLPSQLQVLVCTGSKLTSLPKLPDSLSELYCMGVPLKTLPSFPEGLEELEISDIEDWEHSDGQRTLQEPYASYLDEYNEESDLNEFKRKVNEYNEQSGGRRRRKMRKTRKVKKSKKSKSHKRR